MKNSCRCCASPQVPLGGARSPHHRGAGFADPGSSGVGWLRNSVRAAGRSQSSRSLLAETEELPEYLWAYGIAMVPRRLGRVQEKRGPGPHCMGSRMGPPDLPWKLERVEDPRCFLLSSAYLPLQVYRFCSEATGRRIRGLRIRIRCRSQKSKSVPMSVHLFVFLPGFVGLCITSCSRPSKLHPPTTGRVEGGDGQCGWA